MAPPDGQEGAGSDQRADPSPSPPHGHPINHVVATLILCLVIFLVLWEIYLGRTLPPRFDARHWRLLWIGFDAFEILALTYTAWAIWFRRQIMVPTAIVAGTLLLCDAWFDVVSAAGSRGMWLTVATAVVGEVPLGIFFYWVAWRVMVRSVAAYHAALGQPGDPPRLRDARLVFAVVDTRSDAPEPPESPPSDGRKAEAS